jgi:Cu/Ag efflux protein CusF
MKTDWLLTPCVALTLMTPAPAAAQTKTIQGEMTTVTGTVEAIDAARRVLTIKDNKGEYDDIDVPDDVKGFSTVKVGDKLTLRYYDNVVLRLKLPGEADVNTGTAAVTPATGTSGAGTAATQRTITATITAIDPSVPSITVKGPNNWVYSSRVQDKKALSKVKVGDKLDITWTNALLVSLQPHK